VDELFPLQTVRIRNVTPRIFVTFQQNMSTLQYILGNEKKKQMKLKRDAEKKKIQEE
jgi:hypothetical protein